MFGGGIYFAPTLDLTLHKAHRHGVVFACVVDLGRPYIAKRPAHDLTLDKLRAMGFDSLVAVPGPGSVSQEEFVVYESARVLSFVAVNSDTFARGRRGDADVTSDAMVGEFMKAKFPRCVAQR
jgi:hypothetical protein